MKTEDFTPFCQFFKAGDTLYTAYTNEAVVRFPPPIWSINNIEFQPKRMRPFKHFQTHGTETNHAHTSTFQTRSNTESFLIPISLAQR